MDTQLLEDIGLTRSEALVYIALCDLGPSNTGKIVENSGVASSKIYELLDKLEKKGLASHVIKTGVKEFEAAPPERILLYIEEKEQQIKNEKLRAERFITLLKSKLTLAKEQQEATIYRGFKGLKTVFYQCIKEMKPHDTMLVFGVPARSPKIDRFFVRWNKFRAKHGVKMKIIFNENARNQMQLQPGNSPLSEIKFMPEDVLMQAGVNVSNDKTIIFPAESGEDPIIIEIRSKKVADSFRTQFELLWNQNVRTFYGIEGPKFVLNELMKSKGDNFAFGLEKDKFNKHVPEELSQLVELQNEGKIKPPRLIFTGMVLKELSKTARYKILPEKYSTPFHYEIYGNKVAIFYWINPVITTVIDDRAVADNFRKHFEAMWKLAK